jgi:hypothetical protein
MDCAARRLNIPLDGADSDGKPVTNMANLPAFLPVPALVLGSTVNS